MGRPSSGDPSTSFVACVPLPWGSQRRDSAAPTWKVERPSTSNDSQRLGGRWDVFGISLRQGSPQGPVTALVVSLTRRGPWSHMFMTLAYVIARGCLAALADTATSFSESIRTNSSCSTSTPCAQVPARLPPESTAERRPGPRESLTTVGRAMGRPARKRWPRYARGFLKRRK